VFFPITPKVTRPFLFLPQLEKKKSKSKGKLFREFQYTPSLVALEGNIRGKAPKVLTGIEIRAILK